MAGIIASGLGGYARGCALNSTPTVSQKQEMSNFRTETRVGYNAPTYNAFQGASSSYSPMTPSSTPSFVGGGYGNLSSFEKNRILNGFDRDGNRR